MLSVQIQSVVRNRFSRSVREANGKETGYSRSIRPIREGFGKRSENAREEYDAILNQTSHTSCIRKGFQEDSPKNIPLFIRAILNQNIKTHSTNIRKHILFSVTAPLWQTCAPLLTATVSETVCIGRQNIGPWTIGAGREFTKTFVWNIIFVTSQNGFVLR